MAIADMREWKMVELMPILPPIDDWRDEAVMLEAPKVKPSRPTSKTPIRSCQKECQMWLMVRTAMAAMQMQSRS